MQKEHIEQLKYMARMYGTFAVTAELAVDARISADTDYANNPDAIIHRDAQVLEDAVLVMRHSHPLRGA